jgi:hypothetical protein
LNFYFKRMTKRVHVTGTIGSQEGGADPLAGIDTAMAGKDYLVIAFAHAKPKEFPATTRQLGTQYELVANYLDANDRGFMVWKKRAAGPDR